MELLPVKKPVSAGILLSYKCTGECLHCMYACSPRWSDHWMDVNDLRKILENLAKAFSGVYPVGFKGVFGVNYGLHFTGGEPFLKFNLLLKAVELADKLGIPGKFVETNCFWCVNEEVTRSKFERLREAGLDGVLISANPFVIEHVPFERIKRAVKVAEEIFGRRNVMIYHPLFYEQLIRLGVRGTVKFERYLDTVLRVDPGGLLAGFNPSILLPMGRAVYRLSSLYRKYPAKHFLNESCLSELTRPWHVHIDCFCNYIPGYCAGLTLGDARNLDDIVNGVELDDKPILKALSRGLKELYEFAVKEYGYKERKDGYISKCHLCLDIRRYIALQTDEYKELKPREFYLHL